ncbi:MAG TPA: metallophosphoesterase, partial [Myxococcota bacterium]|nr:metallophosphoesterase [Myxococcota bacterium]
FFLLTRQWWSLMLLLLLACASSSPAPAAEPPAPTAEVIQGGSRAEIISHGEGIANSSPSNIHPAPERLIAVGDLHGNLQDAVAVLKMAGLVDDKAAWIGGKSWLVQTGDTTDRGPDSRGVMALLRRLQTEALAAGGKVVPLMGNHEVMNMIGDWRYVSPEDLAGYGGEGPRKQAFSVEGEDGRWLLGLGVTAKVGDSVFVHGGIDPHWAELGIDGINNAVRTALLSPTPKTAAILGNDGPVWNRAYVLGDPPVECPRLKEALTKLSATRMVVGHTTREDGKIESRCDGALWVIDTGISAHYGSHHSALEIKGSEVRALYPASP